MKEPKLVLIHKKHGYFLPKEESIVGTYNVKEALIITASEYKEIDGFIPYKIESYVPIFEHFDLENYKRVALEVCENLPEINLVFINKEHGYYLQELRSGGICKGGYNINGCLTLTLHEYMVSKRSIDTYNYEPYRIKDYEPVFSIDSFDLEEYETTNNDL